MHAQEYDHYVQAHYSVSDASLRTEDEHTLLRQVRVDIPRTCPNVALFAMQSVQSALERCKNAEHREIYFRTAWRNTLVLLGFRAFRKLA